VRTAKQKQARSEGEAIIW
jgi:hypothetical protein